MAPVPSPVRYGMDNYPSSPIHHLTEGNKSNNKAPNSPITVAQAHSSAPVSPVPIRYLSSASRLPQEKTSSCMSPQNLCIVDSQSSSSPSCMQSSRYSEERDTRVISPNVLQITRYPLEQDEDAVCKRETDNNTHLACPKFQFRGNPRERLDFVIDSSTDRKPEASPVQDSRLYTITRVIANESPNYIKNEQKPDLQDLSSSRGVVEGAHVIGTSLTDNKMNNWEWSDTRNTLPDSDISSRHHRIGKEVYEKVLYRVKHEPPSTTTTTFHDNGGRGGAPMSPPHQFHHHQQQQQQDLTSKSYDEHYQRMDYTAPQYGTHYTNQREATPLTSPPPHSNKLSSPQDTRNIQLSPDSTQNHPNSSSSSVHLYPEETLQYNNHHQQTSSSPKVVRRLDHSSLSSSSSPLPPPINQTGPSTSGSCSSSVYVVAPCTSTELNSTEIGSSVSNVDQHAFLAPAPPAQSTQQNDSSSSNSENRSGNLYAVIDKIIIEFDGTTLLCRVCGDRSSGFHYGVHSCEGCKGFFRRSIQQKIQYRQCSKNQQCLVQKTNRNRCQYCRLKKCIEVGMSKDAVRFGRVPKNEKERIRQAMEKASNSSNPHSDLNDVSDEVVIRNLTRSFETACVVLNDNIRELIRAVEQSPTYGSNDPASLCPLHPCIRNDNFQNKFSPIVREVVSYAKDIPGFIEVSHEDKITLLRACVFEVLLIRFTSLIDTQNKRMVTISGYIINASIYANSKVSNDFVNTLFTFVNRINSLSLTDTEMALLTAAIIANPKRLGIANIDQISTIHKKVVHCLQLVMQRERPNNPNIFQELVGTLNDLWILNGMHSNQAQAKQKWNANTDSTIESTVNRHHFELSNKSGSSYAEHSEPAACANRYTSSSLEYEEKRMPVDDSSPTSPTSTLSPDEEMRSPGSADSGCSTDSGCSIESSCSSDSGYSQTSHINDHPTRSYGLHPEEHREVICTPEEETAEELRKCHIKRKPIVADDSRMETEKSQPLSWHKPQKESEKNIDSPVLRMCLESPSSLKMEGFNAIYSRPGHGPSHPHKKFRPSHDRAAQPHETLESSNSSPRPSTTPSPSYSNSPSPSSSISSSPSRISSSPYSSTSLSSSPSPANVSILAHRLAMPMKKFPKTSSLMQTLAQEPKFGHGKALLSDTLHECIMKNQTKIPRQHVMAAPSPSRYDDLRNLSPMQQSMTMSPQHSIMASPPPSHHSSSPPHNYSSPPLSNTAHIPPAHSPPNLTPTGLGASAMGGPSYSYASEPLNLSTKTPSPPPVMES